MEKEHTHTLDSNMKIFRVEEKCQDFNELFEISFSLYGLLNFANVAHIYSMSREIDTGINVLIFEACFEVYAFNAYIFRLSPLSLSFQFSFHISHSYGI